ncbi:MAG: hypothetical protein H7124_07830 [Phycisphaerales bacterium]|nr:hypothetical protein [Hyphomonadaceae bacterium]
MMRKFVTLLAVFAVAASAFAPAAADARDRRGGYYDGDPHGRHYNHRRHRDDDGDAVVAGVVGLALGLALGSMASQQREPRRDASCYDNYQRCAPPPRSDHYEDSYYEGDEEYYDGAYERDYAEPAYQQCTRQERQWDRYADRYVVVDVPC